MRLEGAHAVVFGGASGLGAATARRLSAAGAMVAVADIDEEKGERLAAEEDVRFIGCDVTSEAPVQQALELLAEESGSAPRLVVSCAGRGFPHRTASTKGPHPLEPFKRIVELNLVGTFNVFRLAAAAMTHNQPDDQGERGLLVATASAAAFEGQIGQVAYSASKAGIVGMTLTIARDMARDGIRAVTIAPGLFDTPLLGRLDQEARDRLAEQVPFPSRLGAPDEYARLVEAIAENPMLNGTTVRLDGAVRMSPR